jgi:hypothetical protein
MVCGECGFNRAVVRLKFTLVWTEADGCRRYILLKNDRNMMFLYMYAANKPELYVSVEKISNVVDGNVCEPAVAGETIGSGNERIDMEYTEQANEEAEMPISIPMTRENEEIGDLPEDEEMSAWTGSSSDEEFVPSDDSYDGEDDVPSTSGHFVYGDIGEDNGEEEIAEGLNMWDGNTESIDAGVYFKSKRAVQDAVAAWSVKRGMTYRTVESRKRTCICNSRT